MPYLIQRAAFTHSGVTSRCSVPFDAVEQLEFVPGQTAAGAYQPAAPRPAGRYTRLRGVQLELRGQAASGTMTPEGDLLRAAGFARSGTTGFTFTLGDPHLNSGTPSGDTVPLSTAALNVDGQEWGLANAVADLRLLFRAGEIPLLTCDLLGVVPPADAGASTAIRKSSAQPSVTAGPLPLTWGGSTLSVTPAGGSAVTDLVVTEIATAVNNRLAPRRSASGSYGFAAPDIAGRDPAGHLLLEMPPEATAAFEDYAVAGTALALSWTYLAAGSSFRTITCTQTVRIGAPVEFADVNAGHAGYRVPFVQDPDSGPLALAWS